MLTPVESQVQRLCTSKGIWPTKFSINPSLNVYFTKQFGAQYQYQLNEIESTSWDPWHVARAFLYSSGGSAHQLWDLDGGTATLVGQIPVR